MAFADLLELVGSTGRFQIIHVTLLSLPILMMASHNLLQNFVALVPPHHCRAPKNFSAPRLDPSQAVRLFVPLEADGQLSKCRRYATPQFHLQTSNASSRTADTPSKDLQGCEDGWDYDTSEMSSTIISEWDLVCDRRSYKQMGQSVYMGGVLVGSVVFGGLADRFGRRMLLLLSHLLMAVSGTCAAFAPSFPLFCLFRFLCGMALSGMILNSFSLILEWIPTKVRTVVGTATGYCYTMGQLILAGVAYFVRDWRWLTLAVSMPFYISFLYSWWLQESARWLVLSRKPEQAVKNLRVVAHINGREAEGRRINAEVLHKLRLLWLIHGPPKVRSGHLPDPGDLRGGGHPRQGHRRCVHEQNWQAAIPVCRPHPGRCHHPHQPGSAVRNADPADQPGRSGQRLLGCLLQLLLLVLWRTLSHGHPPERDGLGLHDGACWCDGGPPGPASGGDGALAPWPHLRGGAHYCRDICHLLTGNTGRSSSGHHSGHGGQNIREPALRELFQRA
ncbi:solute carrier family 22 member 6 isoform X2 [Paramormyrops kingsleyae]|uniref:solute carrier family 22 member 6 isoform X2 n=1 Tax=Paramormyrops kingsleyae TaxID=1676925 RepID=UPI003B97C0B5